MATQKERNQAKLSRREKMIALRKKGLLDSEIAAELGVTQRAVSTALYRAKQEGMDVPKAPYNADRSGANRRLRSR